MTPAEFAESRAIIAADRDRRAQSNAALASLPPEAAGERESERRARRFADEWFAEQARLRWPTALGASEGADGAA